MVELKIKIYREEEDSNVFCAELKTEESITAGHGKTPYEALRDLVNELEFQHQYFRADNE